MARLLPASLLIGIALSGAGLLWFLALLLLVRRLNGGIIEPLPAAAACAVSLSLAASALIARAAGLLAWLAHCDRLERAMAWALFLLPGLACFVAAVAISLPQTTAAADAWLYLPLSLAEVVSLAIGAWVIRRSDRGARWLTWSTAGARRPPLVRRQIEVSRSPLPATEELLPTGVSQQLVRRRLPDGHDCYQGTLRVQFATGQRTEVLHVAFCPPFDSVPQWTAKAVRGPALSIKQVQVFPYGARLEVRLSKIPPAAAEALVSFSAVENKKSGEVSSPAQ